MVSKNRVCRYIAPNSKIDNTRRCDSQYQTAFIYPQYEEATRRLEQKERRDGKR